MMLRRALVWIFLVVAFVAVRVYWFTAPRVVRGDAASIEGHLVEQLRGARIGSAALVLMHHGEIGRVHPFGDNTAPLYQVASVSKAVTAFGVMKLVQDGKLQLDEPVRHYRERVTVRQLLSHTAGLDDARRNGDFAPVTHQPGTTLSYSTGGYHVLQLVIEETTAQPFARFMKETVLRPLGMTTASFDPRECRPRLAPSFDRDLVPQPPRDFTTLAGVALCASANDLAQFARAIAYDNPVLTRETLRQMMTPQPGTSGTWGLGLTLFAPGIVGHDGGTPPAWGAMVRVSPATGDGLVLVTSGGSGAVNQLGHDWVYWETGEVTRDARREFAVRHVGRASVAIVLGGIIIVLCAPRRSC
jgi:CubicO group peptidase (beta-lactamase class C family)